MTPSDRPSLLVLVVAEDAAAAETTVRAIEAEGDRTIVAHDVAEAIAKATAELPDVALVDVMTEAGAGLALAHHLRALSPSMGVHALAPVGHLEIAAQAMALGANGLLVSPPSGDDVIRVVNASRERIASLRQTASLERDLARAKRRSDLLDRVLKLARGSGHSEAVRALVQAIAEAGGAHGAALFAAFEDRSECVRLGAVGTARTLPKLASVEMLARAAKERGATALPLDGPRGPLGLTILEGMDPARASEVATVVELAAAVLTLVDVREPQTGESAKVSETRGRIYSAAYFRDTANREVDRALRHGRRLSVAVLVADGQFDRHSVEGAVHVVVRDTDVFAKLENQTYGLLLPETPGWGAAACRRRVLERIAARDAGRISFGVATFPHDGLDLERLLETASVRAREQASSVVRARDLDRQALGAIVDALLARPMLDVGVSSTYPLDVSETALLALSMGACREARRGGAATVIVSTRLAGPVREALREAADVVVRPVELHTLPGCEDVDALVLTAEHGVWACCGRRQRDRFRGVHAADPLLCDLLAERLLQVTAAPLSTPSLDHASFERFDRGPRPRERS